ncbi:MAG: IS1380 family transposase [Candidatus Margulisbacteria bacterium]|nr:IS1380 family transposase [Candidatus Margulisiibacteriota bacterium]
MSTNIQQKLLDFQLQKSSDTLTSKSGLSVFYEAALALGMSEAIKANLPEPKSNRGLKPAEYVLPLALMFCGGGRSMEDIREIELDQGLRKICGLTKIPGADAIGEWIRKTKHLAGLKKVNEHNCRKIVLRSDKDDFTLDTDATLIETQKACAEMSYKGFTSFSVLLSFLADLDLCVCSDYRNGAAHAGTGTKEQIEHTDNLLKSLGRKLKYFRSDSAAYNADVFNTCTDREIVFTITADRDVAVKDAIKRAKSKKWQRLLDEDGKDTGREYTTAVHCMEKTKEPFTLIIQRWKAPQLKLFEKGKYCYYVIATNDFDRDPAATIRFHNKRGNAENYNKEIKTGFGMDYAPSQELAANAVYFEIGVLAYNLVIAVKKLFLEESWAKKTIATLRWQLIFIAGKVIEHGRQLFLKVADIYFELLQSIREKIRLSPAPD